MPAAEQPYHHGSLRQVLLTRAENTLEKDGVDGLSLRRLAREAGVSHAAPSKHFRDRQALLDALVEQGFHRLTKALEQAFEQAEPHPRARLGAVAGTYVTFALTHRELLALMYSSKLAPGAAAEVVEAGRTPMDLTVRIITEAQAAGDIGPGDPWHIALVAFATFHGIATLAAGGMLYGAPVDELVAAASDTFWRGLARE
ncbi:transcriptional regulator [Rhodococcus sp. WMMA185]|uniref:TetR/AcrR family transcriptional regulator n=1 Tax=Rhodococcus sp. WMMA185 TaxID=679318 RepID=UPI000878D5CC|nr:TetR/AcrR family transcriptional regulator [Rhodococcus sp. WMMA185]AOW94696.1 transcriptional regulator [Rhodococcus sp. WMMA185]